MKITKEMIVARSYAQIIVMVSVVNAKLMVINRKHAIVKKIQMVPCLDRGKTGIVNVFKKYL